MTARLRAGAFAVWFYGVTVLFCLASLVLRAACPQHALAFAQTWVRTALAGLRPICGIRLVVSGQHHLPPGGPALIASQHQSEYDTLIWMILLARPAYVMKQELTRIPLFGRMLILAGMIPVDRAAGAGALRALLSATQHAMADGRQIIVFPEGTRVPPGTRVALQPGIAAIAARLRTPVIPVATDSGRHWTRTLLDRPPGLIHIAIGPPIPAHTPRQAMLEAIEAHWHDMETNGFQPVDKRVDDSHETTRPLLSSQDNPLAKQDF